MAETIIMVRVRLHEEDVEAAGAYARSVGDALTRIPGFQGYGMWQGVQEPLARLILFSYASEEAARDGLVVVAERRTLIERQAPGSEPSDALALTVVHAEGVLARSPSQASAVSISIRIAEPGYGHDLVDVYLRTFAELAAIPGFAGMMVAVSQNLAEEVVGLVAWDDEAAFRASLPRQKVYQVKLYERIFEG